MTIGDNVHFNKNCKSLLLILNESGQTQTAALLVCAGMQPQHGNS